MDTLPLRLLLTPLLIAVASLAGRRWGASISGWLIGLPLTSGPIALILALGQGAPFARAAALGTMAGALTEAVFAVIYGWLALRVRWPMAVLAASLGFGAATALMRFASLPVPLQFALVLAALLLALALMPRRVAAAGDSAPPPLPRWDISVRMLIATSYVLVLTGLAPVLGPQLTGLLSPFPTYGAIMAAFAHQQRGPAAANSVLRGLLYGLFSFATFFLVESLLIERVGIAGAFGAAVAAALSVQAVSLWALRRRAAV